MSVERGSDMRTPFLVRPPIYFRALRREDLGEEYLSWLNDAEVNRYLFTALFPTSPDELARFFESLGADRSQVFFAIADCETNAHIGNLKLGPIDWMYRKATLGLLIGNRRYWGRGIATLATRMAVEYAFDRLDLRRVDLGVAAENAAAVRAYEKVGFKVEGRFREDLFLEGRPMDRLWMGLLRSEYVREEPAR